jgi:hypothetical protein
MDMKKLLESMDTIEECGVDEGMPMVPPMSPQPQEDKGNPVTVNVSMNASGKEHVADLLDMMKNAGLKDAEPVGPDMLPMRRDMERLAGIMDDPKIPGKDDVPGDDDVRDMGCNDDIEIDDEAVAEYDNEPEEEYKAIDDVINSGDDLHRSKKAYAATQDGDNPMAVEDEDETTYAIKGKSPEAQEELARKASEEATLESSIKEELWAKLSNMKFDEGRGRGKKKAKEDTVEQKTEKCPECGKAGKVKLMACSSCGCS